VVQRYGSANAEYIKGYRGVDNKTGQVFNKSLCDLAKGKINPDYAEQNIKQQAGFAAEVAATSRDNAKAIIDKYPVRTARSEDVAGYGKNHQVVDRVQVLDGHVIDGSASQMKFVKDPEKLVRDISREDGKLSRYFEKTLELPTEQVDATKKYCFDKAKQLRIGAEKTMQQGRHDDAQKLLREADQFETTADNIKDAELTTEEAIDYRENPDIATAKDIVRTSHSAGVQSAQIGAAIGGVISAVQNIFAVAQQKKSLGTAAKDMTVDTVKAGVLGYGTGFVGSAIKGAMQQSEKSAIRGLSKTGLPALVVSTCISLGSTIVSYVDGEISESQMLSEVGEKGAGMLSAGMMAALGQLAIPVPVVSAVIGGMSCQKTLRLHWVSDNRALHSVLGFAFGSAQPTGVGDKIVGVAVFFWLGQARGFLP